MGEGGMGAGGMGMGGNEGASQSVKGAPIELVYLNLMAMDVRADGPDGEKVDPREGLNGEFAEMVASLFRRNALFKADDGSTKVVGNPQMKEKDGTSWFEFQIQLSLRDPIVMKDKDIE